jgi:tRNA threonylcarbamoyl adenosine modification protein YeaZ/ribosomal-protein-alanine acetyltransferase
VVVLALDTATRQGSVALLDGEVLHERAGDAARTHGQRLPAELLDWLQVHGRALGDVTRFAVIAGPGSFTGLRVGMATVQGLSLATGIPIVAVPSLEAVAFAWHQHAPHDVRPLAACIDGQRGEVFFQVFAPASRRSLLAAQVATAGGAVEALRRLGAPSVVIAGDGAIRYRDAFAAVAGAYVAATPGTLAGAAARLAAEETAQVSSPHALRPIYIRRPDAELARDRAAARPPAAEAGLTVDRVTSPADIAAVEALQRDAFTNPWGAEAIRWELENTDVARLYVLRSPAREILAYCACWLIFDELHINSLAVAAAQRRRGLATTLLRAVLRDAAAAGVTSATLEVRRSNTAALALYEKLDFKVEAVRRDYYQEPREDALVLWNRRVA